MLVNDAYLQETKTSKTLSYKEYLSPDIFISACHSQKELTTWPKNVTYNKSNEKQQNRKLNGKIILAPLPNQCKLSGMGENFCLLPWNMLLSKVQQGITGMSHSFGRKREQFGRKRIYPE